jgi:hypothetical protein
MYNWFDLSLKEKGEKEGDSRLALKWSKKRDDKECSRRYRSCKQEYGILVEIRMTEWQESKFGSLKY